MRENAIRPPQTPSRRYVCLHTNKCDSGRPIPGGAWSPSLGPVIAILAIQICQMAGVTHCFSFSGSRAPRLPSLIRLHSSGRPAPVSLQWTHELLFRGYLRTDKMTAYPPALRRKCRLNAVCRSLETRPLSHRRCLYYPCGRLPSDMQNAPGFS